MCIVLLSSAVLGLGCSGVLSAVLGWTGQFSAGWLSLLRLSTYYPYLGAIHLWYSKMTPS